MNGSLTITVASEGYIVFRPGYLNRPITAGFVCRDLGRRRETYFNRDPSQFESIGNENVPIQLIECCFPGLAISNAKNNINIIFK